MEEEENGSPIKEIKKRAIMVGLVIVLLAIVTFVWLLLPHNNLIIESDQKTQFTVGMNNA